MLPAHPYPVILRKASTFSTCARGIRGTVAPATARSVVRRVSALGRLHVDTMFAAKRPRAWYRFCTWGGPPLGSPLAQHFAAHMRLNARVVDGGGEPLGRGPAACREHRVQDLSPSTVLEQLESM